MSDFNKDFHDEGSARILVVVVGGNISQMTGRGDKLEPATDQQVKEFLLKGNNSSIYLKEGKTTTPTQIFVDVKRLIPVDDLEKQDSSQVNPNIWQDLAQMLDQNYRYYEGFVVLHGLDTLAYTASAISFMLRNITKPIVFTGSQRPLNFYRSDALQNIYTSITIAASKSLELEPSINEVTIYLHDTLYRANRASMSSASSYRAFNSLNYPELATIGEHIDIKENLILKKPKEPYSVYRDADKKIQIIDVFPGMSSSIIEGITGLLDNIYFEKLKKAAQFIVKKYSISSSENFSETNEAKVLQEIENRLLKHSGDINRLNKTSLSGTGLLAILPKIFDDSNGEAEKRKVAADLIMQLEEEIAIEGKQPFNKNAKVSDHKIHGVILRTYGMGTLPTDVLEALQKLVQNGIIVMNVTQAHSSRVSFSSDLVSLRLYEHGVISGLDMTSEAAFAKMVIILSNVRRKEQWAEELQKNIAGEQSYTVNNFHFVEGKTNLYVLDEDERRKRFYDCKEKLSHVHEYDLLNFARIGVSQSKINNIQLRVLGLKKINKGGGRTVGIKLYRSDDNGLNLLHKEPIHEFDVVLDSDNDGKTVNVSFDITYSESLLFTDNESFYIVSDQEIGWSKISIVIYT